MLHVSELKPAALDAVIAVEEDFDFLSGAYRELFKSSCATAFQAPVWMHTIHKCLVPELALGARTITLRDRLDASLLAVFPMVVQRASALTMLQPADFGVCDYNAPVAARATLDWIAGNGQVLAQLRKAMAVGDFILYRKQRNADFDMAQLLPRSKSSPAENHAYHCDLDDDFETWRRETLRKKATKELGRKQRQLALDFENIGFECVTSPDEVETALRLIQQTRRDRFDADLLQNPVYFNFYRDFAVSAIAEGEAELRVINHNGKPIAALLGLTGDGAFHAVLIGADTDGFAKYSLGIQLIYQTIKQHHAAGERLFDMGLGNSGYKSHFRVIETGLHNLSSTRSLPGAGAAFIYHRLKPIKNFVRRWAPNLR